MSNDLQNTRIRAHFAGRHTDKVVFMLDPLLERVAAHRLSGEICKSIRRIRDNPLNCNQETLDHSYGFNIHVLWEGGFYYLYRYHKPSSGPFSTYRWLVHILDIGEFHVDVDGNRILDIYDDPDALRILRERDGKLIDVDI